MHCPYSTSECHLVAALAQRKPEALNYVFKKYSKALTNTISQRVACHNTAEEILQNVFVKIWFRIETYKKQKGSLYTWMQKIAANECIDHFRKAHSELPRQHNEVPHDSESITNEIAACVDRIDLARSFASLRDTDKRILWLIIKGYTRKEISIELGLPEGTVKTRTRVSYARLNKYFTNDLVKTS
jgi:RNA polymerase sigma factor (sigma-70 family)